MERRTVGTVEITALIDNLQSYPAAAVYPEAGGALGRFSAYFDDSGGLPLSFAAFLIADGDSRILIDTGWGPEANGHLPAELRAAGIRPEDVTAVAFTHLHGDHTGWTLDRKSGAPLFPNARYLAPKGDWDHYSSQDPEPESFARDVRPLMAAGRVDLIEGEVALSTALTALPTPGHTPGHTSFLIRSGDALGCVLGDVVIGRPDAELPSLRNSFDYDSRVAQETRSATIERLAADRSLVAASHLPAPGFGRFLLANGVSSWAPA